MAGELTSIFQPSLGIIISPLRNSNANAKVIGLVARLLSLPFVITSVTKETLEEIKKVNEIKMCYKRNVFWLKF